MQNFLNVYVTRLRGPELVIELVSILLVHKFLPKAATVLMIPSKMIVKVSHSLTFASCCSFTESILHQWDHNILRFVKRLELINQIVHHQHQFQNVRQLTRELRLQMLLIDSFIPAEYQ